MPRTLVARLLHRVWLPSLSSQHAAVVRAIPLNNPTDRRREHHRDRDAGTALRLGGVAQDDRDGVSDYRGGRLIAAAIRFVRHRSRSASSSALTGSSIGTLNMMPPRRSASSSRTPPCCALKDSTPSRSIS